MLLLLTPVTGFPQSQDVQDVIEPQRATPQSNRADLSQAKFPHWTGKVGFGLLTNSGNVDSRNIAAQLNIYRKTNFGRHHAFGSYYESTVGDTGSARRSELGYTLDWDVTQGTYAFLRLRHETDKFGNIDSRGTLSTGLGRSIFKDNRYELAGEIGLGAESVDYVSPVDDTLNENGVILYLGLKQDISFNAHTRLNSVLNTEFGSNNIYTILDSSIEFMLSEQLALNLGVQYRRNSRITGLQNKKNDLRTHWSITYTRKPK